MSKEERRATPAYPLAVVRRLAAAQRINYLSSRVTFDVENLEYTPADVARCLARLAECHFRSSIRYPGSLFWLDEYLIRCTGRQPFPDELYVKLKLHRERLFIELASFHREH